MSIQWNSSHFPENFKIICSVETLLHCALTVSPGLDGLQLLQKLILTTALRKIIMIDLFNTKRETCALLLTLSLSIRFLQSAGTSLLDFFNLLRSIFIVKSLCRLLRRLAIATLSYELGHRLMIFVSPKLLTT